MAAGGFKGGEVYGETDDFPHNIDENSVHINDLHATLRHQVGLEHHQLTFQYQGLDQKLTGAEPATFLTDPWYKRPLTPSPLFSR